MFKSYSMRVKLLDFVWKSVTTQRFLSCLFPPHVVFRSFCQDSIPSRCTSVSNPISLLSLPNAVQSPIPNPQMHFLTQPREDKCKQLSEVWKYSSGRVKLWAGILLFDFKQKWLMGCHNPNRMNVDVVTANGVWLLHSPTRRQAWVCKPSRGGIVFRAKITKPFALIGETINFSTNT